MTTTTCMLCGTLITKAGDLWVIAYMNDNIDEYWYEHCTGHDLSTFDVFDGNEQGLRHVPKAPVHDVAALEKWLV